MRYLILSDIHANWEALQAVIAHASGLYDSILNCGDLVGYGPDPDRVVEFCRNACDVSVRGNHDKAVSGRADMNWFNWAAKQAVLWAQITMKPRNLEYLADMARGPVQVDGFSLMHGSPGDEDEYLIDTSEARVAAETVETGLSFFGHTHLQGGFLIHRNGSKILVGPEVQIEDTATYLINPGSVGQPRDGDPRAAYAIYDSASGTVFYRRVEYSVMTTHQKIVDAGLPQVLGLRLFQGH